METAKIAERWRGYYEDMCDDKSNCKAKYVWKETEDEAPTLKLDVELIIKAKAKRKASGPDEVLVELIQAGGEIAIDSMQASCIALWKTREWPEDGTTFFFIPLSKTVI
jgi:hypothetical protein